MYVSDRWLSWLGTCMYLTVDFPGLVHVCIWPLTYLAWYMYASERWYQARKVNSQIHTCTKPGKSTVRYIHAPSQESQRSDTYMYQARKVNSQIHTCTKPRKSTVRYIHVPSQESLRSDTYMYQARKVYGQIHTCRRLSWLGTCRYLTVDFPGLVHVCIWPLTFLA
jgi:hypothetical protein